VVNAVYDAVVRARAYIIYTPHAYTYINIEAIRTSFRVAIMRFISLSYTHIRVLSPAASKKIKPDRCPRPPVDKIQIAVVVVVVVAVATRVRAHYVSHTTTQTTCARVFIIVLCTIYLYGVRARGTSAA